MHARACVCVCEFGRLSITVGGLVPQPLGRGGGER